MRRTRRGKRMTFAFERSAARQKSEETIRRKEPLFSRNSRKKSRESAAKKKEIRSVRPEIQETFSKWAGKTEKSSAPENEAGRPNPSLIRSPNRRTQLRGGRRMLVRWKAAGFKPQT